MDILSILSEPAAPKEWIATYRPVAWLVQADALVPADQPMYADIYFGDPDIGAPFTYYKTISSYTIDSFGGFSVFTFDIQDALQEYIKFFIPEFGNTFSIQQADAPLPLQLTQCIVYFRGSTISGNILTPNPVIPTQGTATTAPVSTYSGTPSSTFTTVLSTLNAYYENITDNDLTGFLQSKTVTDVATYYLGSTRIYPLSDLPLNKIDLGHNVLGSIGVGTPDNFRDRQGMFPIMILQFGNSGILPIDIRNCSTWCIFSTNGGPAATSFVQILAPQAVPQGTFYLPLGLLDMSLLMTTINYNALINPNNNNYYRIALYDEDAAKWCFFSPMYKVMPGAVQGEVFWFQNNYGHFEQASFVRSSDKFAVSSSSQFTPYNVPDPYNSIATQGDFRVGHKRYNIRSNDTIEVTALLPESLLPWLKELFRSPFVLQDIPTISGSRFILNPNQLFRSVTVLDDTFTIRKVVTEAGTKYQITVKVVPAIDNINLRN